MPYQLQSKHRWADQVARGDNIAVIKRGSLEIIAKDEESRNAQNGTGLSKSIFKQRNSLSQLQNRSGTKGLMDSTISNLYFTNTDASKK
jgi:hypothetical protein